MARKKINPTEERDKAYLAALQDYLRSSKLTDKDKECLSYFLWRNNELSFSGRSRALQMIADSVDKNTSSVNCAFSQRNSLKGFLELYCDLMKRLEKELPDSKHGIDFWWKIVTDAEPDSNNLGPASVASVLFEDEDEYGDFELAKKASMGYMKRFNRQSTHPIISTEYWYGKNIHIQIHLNHYGDLQRITPASGYDNACAFLLACLKVEKEEGSAYWDEYRALKYAGLEEDPAALAAMEHKRINPLMDIDGNRRLEFRREYHQERYRRILDGFSRFDAANRKDQLERIEREFINHLEAQRKKTK